MSTFTLESILARARTAATQMGTDPSQSLQIDSKGGLRVLLNSVINNVYRQKAKDLKFLRDITVRHDISISSGTGAMPTTIMKEFMRMADITDENNSKVTYYDFAADYNSSANFDQLGYCLVVGDSILYTEPAPGDATSYSGDLFVTTPSVPVISTSVTFPSTATGEDVILELARAIRNETKFEVIDMAA